jgi:hypothetical protein
MLIIDVLCIEATHTFSHWNTCHVFHEDPFRVVQHRTGGPVGWVENLRRVGCGEVSIQVHIDVEVRPTTRAEPSGRSMAVEWLGRE